MSIPSRIWCAFACELLALIAACAELFGKDLEVAEYPFFIAFVLDLVALALTFGVAKHPDAEDSVRRRAKLAIVLALVGIALIPVVYVVTVFGAGIAAAGR